MTTVDQTLPLAITCGDPAGVGPEVIAGALRMEPSLAKDCVLIGAREWAEPLSAELGMAYESVGAEDFSPSLGVPSLDGAQVALDALKVAAQGCVAGRFRGVVSGPVSKHWLQQVGFKHPGQTEFFAEAWGGEPTMGFVGNELKVVLATWHIPLREVADALTAECLILAVERAYALGKSLGVVEPRIGVCGLNPHAGEGGILGVEERDVLDPALDHLRENIPGLSKCLPGDTVFFRQRKGEFDVVVSAYHDQGLAAVKTLEFDAAVNVTLGLPYVRTSPDHGTAYDIAGKDLADCGSFAAALKVARQLTM
ncbi:MAG: 4-hydroxythreonine-4-phosphate dehydrogenase PdxA [Opitutales bacterium]|jgi:4-hydroxythreonine-4-phosphate dehydrogenase|nr:4-hydroxythreonine-4-phosphate dehydrogenase PdxA [Opitutales bacterium]MDP4645205.1 4-hydroxythreonine-4-phosphate dehydrogenase PdxA [Opitutales bacterium]MDP4778170.1 4-hydroxythreonine-4-phosphate dehydrogenase PdxA [Opitutales bacterium]MDP4883970.1 4-hydroxythreonine-4-phosphate dehydrogenase PdxA [Opitutales bacterium]MDP5080280.1 4-hydroxythreonine-4-phosphate dehydrogenase PdxA [Opitutales bacterium]